MTAKIISKKPLNYYYWPVGIICFFLVIAGFNSFLAFKAFTKRPQATETSPYEAGQKYDQVLEKLSLAKTLGLQNEFVLAKEAKKLKINYKLPNSLPMDDIISAKLEVIRPNDSKLNSNIKLIKDTKTHSLYGYTSSTQVGLRVLEMKIQTNKGIALVKAKSFFR
ncbi:MAG: FixH family protein [Bdellovibrionota bacterium]